VTDFLLLSAFQSSQAMTNTIRMSVASPQFLYLVLSNNVAGGAVTTQRIMQVFQQ
jgi:hypothetical protein